MGLRGGASAFRAAGRWCRRGGIALALAAAVAPAARAANVATPANPIDRLLTIQPYQVCDDAGASCAPITFLPQYLTAANTILNQAGIAVAAAPVVRLNASAYLNPTTNGTNFDNVRDLVRLPQNAPATTSPNTLNVWFVNTLTDVTRPASPTPFFGFGLIGGNGAVVATGRASNGLTAAVDTLAHELAHNLGLPHPEDAPQKPLTQNMVAVPRPGLAPTTVAMPYRSPRNLMQSVGRAIPTASLCDVPPYTCATGTVGVNGRGVLVTEQITALRNPPIFTQLPLVAGSAAPTVSGGVVTRSDASVGFVTFNPSLPGIARVAFRFRNATVFPFTASVVVPANPALGYTPAVTQAAVGSNSEIAVELRNPLLAEGQGLEIIFAGTPDAGLPAGLSPYSTQYNFLNGITSRAGFDQTGLAFTRRGLEFGFDPTAPDVPSGPSFLPQDLDLISPITGLPIEPVIDFNGDLPSNLAALELPFGAFEPPPPLDYPGGLTAVPLPPALPLFAAAALGLLGLRRRAEAA